MGIGYVMNGQTESGHGGGLMITKAQMAEYLADIDVPSGTRVLAAKYAHSASSSGSYVQFSYNGGTSSSSISSPSWGSTTGFTYDLPFCACKLNEDCPDFYE